MGWPRGDDGLRLYRDRDKSYFMIVSNKEALRHGGYDAVANVYPGPRPSLASTQISPSYFANRWPTRVQWDELPEEWKAAFRYWLNSEESPNRTRGFWRVGNQPAH